MTSIYTSVSQAELTQRRHQLQRQRRIKSFQAIWRSLFISGLAGSLLWVTTLPNWVISQPEQINIKGNQLLSAPAIRALLSLSYPQSLLRLQPQVIAQKLESQSPIAEATVTRQLLPPALTIQVKERQPVAIAESISPNHNTSLSPSSMGFLDAQGVWISIDSYAALKRPLELPTLKVIGLTAQSRPDWPAVYQIVSHSPIKVFEIDWQDPANLIVKTELGNVHLGSYSSRLAEQLSVLDRMRELPAHINASQLAYIDLKNPDFPSIQMKNSKESSITKTQKAEE